MNRGGYLTSPLLDRIDGLVHGFTGRPEGDFATDGQAKTNLLAATGMEKLLFLKQVHSDGLVATAESNAGQEADGWVGRPAAGTLVGVRTADCLPVLVIHPSTGKLAALHAGWRSAAAGIVAKGVEALGVTPSELVAAMGPAIRGCCFEVGKEVATLFPSRFSFPSPIAKDGKYHLDLAAAVTGQLFEAGIERENIDTVGGCTMCSGETCFSHRNGDKQRMATFAGWKI